MNSTYLKYIENLLLRIWGTPQKNDLPSDIQKELDNFAKDKIERNIKELPFNE